LVNVLKNKETTKIQTAKNTVFEASTTEKTIFESGSTPNTDKAIVKPKVANSALKAYCFQFLFGLGFYQFKINRKRSYLYIALIFYAWFSFFNIFLCDFGRGPFGNIPFLLNISEFHNNYVGTYSIFFSWITGHIIGLVDLLITHRKMTVAKNK